MTSTAPDLRPRVLWWAGAVLLLWSLVVMVVGRLFWQGVLFAAGAQALLMAGVVFGVAVVARRRDPAEPPPEPVEAPKPGMPRRRVPRMEASAVAVLLPSVAAVLVGMGGLVYILPAVALSMAWKLGASVLLGLGAALGLLIGRYGNRSTASLPEGPGLVAWGRSLLWMSAISTAGLWLESVEVAGVADLGVWIPALGGVALVEAVSLLQFGVVVCAGVEPILRAAPGLWAWWNLRDAAAPTSLPAADSIVVALLC